MWSPARARDRASASGPPARALPWYLPGQTSLRRLIPKWSRTRAVVPYVTALLGIAGVTLILFPLRHQIHITVVPLIYLLFILFIASAWGMGPAIITSLAGALAFDYYILPPTNAFNLNNSEDWSALLASEADEDILRAYNLAVNCYITKPVDLDQFIKVVKAIEDFWFTVVKLPPSPSFPHVISPLKKRPL
jgi:hypothetical protein